MDDLVTFARTGRVEMEPARCDLAAAAREVLFEQRELLSERGVEVDVAADLPTVWCNAARVKQVLTNLIRNAVKHGCDPQRPRIAIARHAAGERPGEPCAWIAVRDNGPGIPPESRDDIFLPGKRLAGAHPEGSGMGLPIVQRIIEHYGGRVFVDPAERSGTAIVFSLPSVPADR